MLNRTGLNKEFGYKEPVQRKKKYFNSQWFRYLSLCQLVFQFPSFQPSGNFNRLLLLVIRESEAHGMVTG